MALRTQQSKHKVSGRTRVTMRALPPEWRVAIVCIAFLTFTMTGAFDSLIINVLGFREVPRAARALIAVVVFAFVGCAWLSSRSGAPIGIHPAWRRRPAFEVPLMLMVVLVPFWVLAGLFNGWPITYVVGDVFMLTVLPWSYFALSRNPMRKVGFIFKWLYGSMVAAALFGFVLVVYNNVIVGNISKISLDSALGPIYYSLLRNNVGFSESALVLMLMFGVLLSTKRGTWAGFIFLLIAAFVLRSDRGKWTKAAAWIGVIVAAVGTSIIVAPDFYVTTRSTIEYRIEETQEDVFGGGELSTKSGGRLSEIVGVYDTIAKRQSAVDWMLGLGLGAIITAREGRTRHHIHSTPAAFMARTGIVGTGIWIWFTVSVTMFLWKEICANHSGWIGVQYKFWLGVWLLSAILSVKSLAFWGAAMTGIQLAYLRHLYAVGIMYSSQPRVIRPTRSRLR